MISKFKNTVKTAELTSVDRMSEDINKEINKIKYLSFDNVKYNEKQKEADTINDIRKKKEAILNNNDAEDHTGELEKLDGELLKILKDEQREKLEKELKILETLKNKKGCAARVFKLKDSIVGSKKSAQEPTAARDPATGKIHTDPPTIKKIVINYVTNLL